MAARGGFWPTSAAELGRVTWPTRREVWATTIVVILTSMLFGIYLYVVDVELVGVRDLGVHECRLDEAPE